MLNEALLVKRLQAKDEGALRELINEFELRLLRAAELLTANEQEAEELVYDTFTQAFFSIKKFKQESSLFRWLYRILLNKFYDQLRRRRREIILKSTFQHTMAKSVDAPEKHILSQQYFLYLLSKLHIDQQEILLLRYLEGMKVREISMILNIPQGTVKTRLHYTLSQLKKIIKEMNLLSL